MNICLEPVDGFHLIRIRYIVKRSQRCNKVLVTFHLIFKVKDIYCDSPLGRHVNLVLFMEDNTVEKVQVGGGGIRFCQNYF